MTLQKQRLLAAVEECRRCTELEEIQRLDAAFVKLTATIEAEFKEPDSITFPYWAMREKCVARWNSYEDLGWCFVCKEKLVSFRDIRQKWKPITTAQAAKLLNP